MRKSGRRANNDRLAVAGSDPLISSQRFLPFRVTERQWPGRAARKATKLQTLGGRSAAAFRKCLADEGLGICCTTAAPTGQSPAGDCRKARGPSMGDSKWRFMASVGRPCDLSGVPRPQELRLHQAGGEA